MELSEKMKEELTEEYQEKLEQAEDIEQVKILDDGLSFFETDLKKGETYPMPCDIAESINDGQNAKIVKEEQVEKIKEGQNKKIHALYDKLDWGEDKKKAILNKQFDVDHTDELSKKQAGELIDILNRQFAQKDKKERDVDVDKSAEEVHSFPSGEAGTKMAQKIEQKDEEQIIKEIQGAVSEKTIEEYFYQFKHKGRTVTGPTYKGIMAIFRERGNIDIDTEDIYKTEDDKLRVKVVAIDKANNNRITRTVEEDADERFALRQAESKAQKKAVRALLPDEVITNMYVDWKEKKGKR